VYDRHLIWQRQVERGIMSQREVKKREEMSECKFRPNLTPQKIVLPKKEESGATSLSYTPLKSTQNY